MSKLKVTLKRSTIGCIKAQIGTIEALGLKKVGSSKVFEDSPTLRGMLSKVSHLVEWQEV